MAVAPISFRSSASIVSFSDLTCSSCFLISVSFIALTFRALYSACLIESTTDGAPGNMPGLFRKVKLNASSNFANNGVSTISGFDESIVASSWLRREGRPM